MCMSTELARIALVIAVFAYASMSDLKTYEVQDRVWVALCGLGAPLVMYDVLGGSLALPAVILSVLASALVVGFVYVLCVLGIADVFGLADVKGVVALSLVLPTYPITPLAPLTHLSLLGYPWDFFALSALFNAFLLGFLVVAYIVARNLIEGRTPWSEGGRFFMGFAVPPHKLEGARVELLETFDSDGSSHPSPPYEPDEQETRLMLKLHEKGRLDKVWVSPKVPFMVLLLGGMLTSLVVGDLLVFLLSLMLSVM